MNKTSTPQPTPKDEDEESETSTEEETETEEESDEPSSKKTEEKMIKSDIGALLARSANARDHGRKDGSPLNRSKYSTPEESANRYGGRRRTTTTDEEPPRYGYTSRFLNKSKSSAAIPPDDEDYTPKYSTPAANDEDSKYPSNRSRYMALKERRQRLARSRSSQQFGDEDDAEDNVATPISPTTSNPTAYLASRGYGTSASAHDLSRSRSSHALKSRDSSPERQSASASNEKDGAALSSWARYLKNKYGNRSGGKDKESASGGGSQTSGSASSSAAARRLSLGLPLRSSTDLASSDDDQKNMQGSPTTHIATTAAAGK